ncbi:hypothetical protein [Belnapia sp. F-4-1]|nr:hypothetical protein [Belnapia sp. F-4-1]
MVLAVVHMGDLPHQGFGPLMEGAGVMLCRSAEREWRSPRSADHLVE